MSDRQRQTARDLYLSSLSPDDELAARRAAERTGIPDDDPTWLLLLEVQRAAYETNRGTAALKQVVSDAATRIEQSSTGTLALNDAAISQFANAAGLKLAEDDRVIGTLSAAIQNVETSATRSLHALETSIRDFMRRRVVAPAAGIRINILF
jgi:hypothetical protein